MSIKHKLLGKFFATTLLVAAMGALSATTLLRLGGALHAMEVTELREVRDADLLQEAAGKIDEISDHYVTALQENQHTQSLRLKAQGDAVFDQIAQATSRLDQTAGPQPAPTAPSRPDHEDFRADRRQLELIEQQVKLLRENWSALNADVDPTRGDRSDSALRNRLTLATGALLRNCLSFERWAKNVMEARLRAGQAAVARAVIGMAVAAALAIGCVLFLGWLVIRPLTARLALVRESAIAIGHGRLDARIEVDGSDEIADLGVAFNDMTRRLKNLYDEIQQGECKFRELAETIREVFWISNADCTKFHYVSPAYEELWGRSRQSIYKDARTFVQAIVAEDQGRVLAALDKLAASGFDEEYRITRPDGAMRWIHTRGFCVRGANGQVQRVVGIAIDVTAQHDATKLILGKTALLEAQSNASPDGMLVIDENRQLILSNARFYELFRIPQDIKDSKDDTVLLNHSVSLLKYPDKFLEKVLYLYDHVNEKSRDEIEFKDGRTLDRYSAPVLGQDGRFYGRIWLFRDITEQKRAAEEMRKLSQVVEQISTSVVIADLAGNMTYVNPAFTRNFGYTAQEAVGNNPRTLKSGLTSLETYHEMWSALTAGREWHGELQDRRKDGELIWQLVNIAPLRNAAGETTHYVAVQENITARKTMENELRRAALTDKLTGLPNRAVIWDRLQHAVLRFKRNEALQFAVLFLDVDRFKTINDSLGHNFGDLLLKEVAQRLRGAMRCYDLVSRSTLEGVAARLGGDEFVVLLDGVAKPGDAIAVANRLIAILSRPYRIGQTEVYTTVSVGVVTSNSADYSAEEVLRDADTAMYEAKLAGKGRYVVFDASMHQRVQNRLNLENELRLAIKAGQMFLMYQPIISLKTGRIEGVEALIRWNHPERGLLSPGEFVPIAEDTGLIIPLGDWVLREACGQYARWREKLGDACPRSISVNLSRHQLVLADFPQAVRQVLAKNHMTPACLHLEITEGAMTRDLTATIRMLTAIKEIGVKLDVDDFGTGYSSLACLRQFPIDVLKIDRSFVANLNRGQDFVALVRAVIQLARILRITVVAEGIETPEQAATLRSLECDLGQGYLFSKPLMADEIAGFGLFMLEAPAQNASPSPTSDAA